jgi:hypothetical protein
MANKLQQAAAVGLKNSNTANERNSATKGQVNCKTIKDDDQETAVEKFNRLGVIVEFEKVEDFVEHKAFEYKFDTFETKLSYQKIHPKSIIENKISQLKMINYFITNTLIDENFAETVIDFLVSCQISDDIIRYSINKTAGVIINVATNYTISIYLKDFIAWENEMQECEEMHRVKRTIYK